MAKDLLKTALTIIEKSSQTIIGSVDEDGFPNVKAMLKPREQDGLKQFFFTTNTSSVRVDQFSKNPKSSLYFFDGKSFRGLMLKGTMSVLTDQTTKDRIWRDGDTMYYPQGVTDPDYCVLHFISESGRLYENFHSDSFSVD